MSCRLTVEGLRGLRDNRFIRMSSRILAFRRVALCILNPEQNTCCSDIVRAGTVEFEEFVRLMQRSQIRSRPLLPPGQSVTQHSHSPSTGTGSCSHSSSCASSLNMSRQTPAVASGGAQPRPVSALDTAALDFIDNDDSTPPPMLLPTAPAPAPQPQPQQQQQPPPPPQRSSQQLQSQSPNGHSGPLPSDSLESRDSALPPPSADSEAPKYDMAELKEAFTVCELKRLLRTRSSQRHATPFDAAALRCVLVAELICASAGCFRSACSARVLTHAHRSAPNTTVLYFALSSEVESALREAQLEPRARAPQCHAMLCYVNVNVSSCCSSCSSRAAPSPVASRRVS